MIKTVNLNGSEISVSGPDGDNAEIHNFGTGTVYASKFPNIAADADNVIAVSPGAIDGLPGTGGTVYLLGTGKVQVNFTDEKITKTAAAAQSAASGGGTGVMREYVDQKDNEILASAKEYTDDRTTEIIDTAKEYSDGKSAEIIKSAKEYADNKDAESLAAAKSYADALNSDLSGYIGYTDSDIYGLEADFENSKFTRLAGAVGKNAGADFDSVRAYGGRRRCNLSDSGEVLAYFGDENFAADGSNGQVMVEQPRFYYKVVPLKTEKIDGADGYHLRKARYYISDTPKAGFKIHPAFMRNGIEVDRIYLSAFEGCIYDTSAGAYLLNDEQVADFNADKLSSIAGAKPCTGQMQQLTRANAGRLAHNRGEGWEQATIQAVSATQLLFAIEYASFNCQNTIGMGNVNRAAGDEPEKTGKTLGLGNYSGISVDENKNEYASYRGEENIWGNVWTWIDGINMNNLNESDKFCLPYIADNNFTDNKGTENYHFTGLFVCHTNGYISAFGYSQAFDWLFFASECSGNDKLPISDYIWSGRSGWRCATWGSTNNARALAGIFSTSIADNSAYYAHFWGTRLTCFPIA